jgi:hypothetical protein
VSITTRAQRVWTQSGHYSEALLCSTRSTPTQRLQPNPLPTCCFVAATSSDSASDASDSSSDTLCSASSVAAAVLTSRATAVRHVVIPPTGHPGWVACPQGGQPTASGVSTPCVAPAFLPFFINTVAVSVSDFTTTFFGRPMAAGWQENCAAMGRSTAGALPAAKVIDCGAAQLSTILRCSRRPGSSLTPLMRRARTLANIRMVHNLVLVQVSAFCTDHNTNARTVRLTQICRCWTAAAALTAQLHLVGLLHDGHVPASQQMRKRQIQI